MTYNGDTDSAVKQLQRISVNWSHESTNNSWHNRNKRRDSKSLYKFYGIYCMSISVESAYTSGHWYGWTLILSWSWLNIWFEPIRWFVLGHVTGINSATTTCQPRPANHDMCFLTFWTNQREPLMPNMHQNEEIRKSYWYELSYFISILDKKTIQNGVLSTGWHVIPFKNFYCYVVLRF